MIKFRILLVSLALGTFCWLQPANADPTLPGEAVYEICDWCLTTQDFQAFAEAKAGTRPPGSTEFLIGNPFSEELMRVYVVSYPDQLPISFASPAEEDLTNDFRVAAGIAKSEQIVVIPPGACTHCGSYMASIGQPDFYAWLYQNHVSDIMGQLTSHNSPFIYLIKSYFFGKHATLVVVFPNGDSVKVDLVNLYPVPDPFVIRDETAVDANGNPIGEGGDTDHYGGHGALPDFFNIRIERIVGWTTKVQWYACGPDGEGGYKCEKIRPPNEDDFPDN